jgi:tol-pal system protein YbgF
MNSQVKRTRAGWAVALLLLSPTAPVAAAPPELSRDQRLERLERMLENQSLSDMLLRIEGLQREVQRLRGDLEMQGHAIDALNRRQRELYLDLDQRLSAQTGSAPTPAPAEPTPPPVTPEAPPAPQSAIEPPVAPGDPAREQAAYQQAFDLLKQGHYEEAIAAFRRFLGAYPGGAYADNAQYWLGEASYVTRDFDTAMTDFSRVVERHPNSSKVPGALLKMGFIYYEQHQWAKARDMLSRLRAEYPRSTEARLAEQRLERMRQEAR